MLQLRDRSLIFTSTNKEAEHLPSKPSNFGFVCLAVFTFVGPTVAATNYFLNHFYVTGGYMLDSGFFAYLFTHSLGWPPPNPPSIGGTFFATHFSPILFVYAGLYKIIGFLDIRLPAPVYFSIIQGIWFGLTPFAVFFLLASGGSRAGIAPFIVAAIAVISGFNAISLAAISLPHIELGIPASFLLFTALYCNGSKRWSVVALTTGLLIREDVGLHFFGFLLTLSCAIFITTRTSAALTAAKQFLIIAVCCFVYSCVALLLQRALFVGDDALTRVYLGSPPFAHVTWTFVHDRLYFILHNRAYILAPLAALLIVSAILIDKILFAGVFAVLPWLVLSFFAYSLLAGALTFYYAFPMILSVSWPAVSAQIACFVGLNGRRSTIYKMTALVVPLASLLFYQQVLPEDQRAVPRFSFDWYGKIATNQSAYRRFLLANENGVFLVDDSVASLNAEAVTTDQWKYRMAFSAKTIADAAGLIFQPGSWLAPTAELIEKNAKLTERCKLTNSNFVVLTRHGNLAGCNY